MARFVAFVYDRRELEDWRARHPDHEFSFVAHRALEPSVFVADRGGEARLRKALAQLHALEPFAGVLNTKEGFVTLASRIARDLGLPGCLPDPRLARDKLLMHRALAETVTRPRCVPVGPDGAVPNVRYPCVLKPRFGFDSLGVVEVASAGALSRALPAQRRRLARLDYRAASGEQWLVEEFVPGSEHSVETLVWDGKPRFQVVSDKWPMPPGRFVETGEVMPSRLADGARLEVAAVATRAVAALGIRHGWTHTEVKLAGAAPVVIECAARMGGGYFDALFGEVYGLDRVRVLIDLHLGIDRVPEPIPGRVGIARRHHADRARWVFGVRVPRLSGVRVLHRLEPGALGRRLAGPGAGHDPALVEWIAAGADFAEAAERTERFESALEVTGVAVPAPLARCLEWVSPTGFEPVSPP